MIDGSSHVQDRPGNHDVADLELMPLADPRGWPSTSVLLAHDTMYELVLQPGRRLGPTRVVGWSDVLPREGSPAQSSNVPLNYALVQMNVPKVNERIPVLAIGDNAVPGEVLHKFRTGGASSVVPMVQANVEGLTVGLAADVARGGRIPRTPITGPRCTSTLFVLWLDPRQLMALDAAEVGYDRVLLPADDSAGGVRVVLPSGERLGACYAYVSDRGCLGDGDGRPRPLGDQAVVVASLCAASGRVRGLLGKDPDTWTTQLARSGMADQLREIFLAEGWIAAQETLVRLIERGRDLSEPAETTTNDPMRGANRWLSWDGFPAYVYSQILPATPPPDGAWRAVAPREPTDRQGEAIVRVSAATYIALRRAAHVSVRPVSAQARSEAHRIEAIAAVMVDDSSEARDDLVEIDSILRTAIGATIGEDLVLAPVDVRRRRWADRFVGRPTYVTCRAQVPDRCISGGAVCLLDPLALSMLGTDDGEEVVIEGQADETGQVQEIRIKAFATPESTRHTREELIGGDFGSLYPHVRDTLGVSEDISWIFLDSPLRQLLHLGNQHLATVRVRPSRSFQLRREMREMLLVLGVAFIGLIEIVRQPWARAATMAALVLVMVVAVAVRMRGRLSHRVLGRRRRPASSTV